MQIKVLPYLIALGFLLLASLGLLALRCEKEGYNRLLLVYNTDERASLTPGQAESFCEDEFLLTYEIRKQISAEAHNYRQPAVLVGTNSCYAQVMGNRMVSGSFFTKAAWKSQSREVALNETAAFQLFGSNMIAGQLLRIDGQSWVVTGVMEDDGSGGACIYAPSSVTGGQIADLMVLMDEGRVNADYAKNALKQIGVYDNSYMFVNLAGSAALFKGRFWVAIRVVCCLLALFLMRWGYNRLSRGLLVFRERLQEVYLSELLKSYRKEVIKTALTALSFLAGLAALLILALQILSICLEWQGVIPADGSWARGSFAAKTLWLHSYQPWGIAAFIASLVIMAVVGYIEIGIRN